MQPMELPFQKESEQNSKTEYPRVTMYGKEYIVSNAPNYTKEMLGTMETFILTDPNGEVADTYYKTKYGKAKECERRLLKSDLSKYIIEHTFERYSTPNDWQMHIKNNAIEFVEKPKGWFVLMGQSGCGKTHICNAVAIELMRKGNTLEYMLWMNEINNIKYNMQDNRAFIKKFAEPDILYIDDFLKTKGKTEPTDIEIELAFQVIDARYREHKITIISTEKMPNQLKYYDEALYGRIAERAEEGQNFISVKQDNENNRNYRETRGINQ